MGQLANYFQAQKNAPRPKPRGANYPEIPEGCYLPTLFRMVTTALVKSWTPFSNPA